MPRPQPSDSPFEPGTIRFAARSADSEPYFRLFAAVLYRGALDFAMARMGQAGRDDEVDDINDWLMETQDLGPGSFVWLCNMLGWEPADVRKTIMRDYMAIYAFERRGRNSVKETA